MKYLGVSALVMADTKDAAVKTYVTPEEKEIWRDHADQLDMSLAEYVRDMVNAGKRNFDLEPVETLSTGHDPGGEPLETRVLQTLRVTGYASWEELIAQFDDIEEDQLHETLQELQSENRIGYDGPNGGYTLIDDE